MTKADRYVATTVALNAVLGIVGAAFMVWLIWFNHDTLWLKAGYYALATVVGWCVAHVTNDLALRSLLRGE